MTAAIPLSVPVYLRHHPRTPRHLARWTFSQTPAATRSDDWGVTSPLDSEQEPGCQQRHAAAVLGRLGLALRWRDWQPDGDEWSNEIISFDPLVPGYSPDVYARLLDWLGVPYLRHGCRFALRGARYGILRSVAGGTMSGAVNYDYSVVAE